MSLNSQSEYFYYTLILLTAGVLCFMNLGGHPIYILDEAKNAEAAREMFLNNNWITPTFNGELRTDKPPLHYWFMILSYKLFGVNAFSARFFSAFFGVMTVISTYHFTKKFSGKKVGLITAFILCSAIFFMQEFHLAVPDPYLIFFVSFGLFQFYNFYLFGKRSSWLLFYIALGLGVLAKGPIAIALPGIIILSFLLFKRDFNWSSIKRINPFIGLALSISIALPWFYVVHQATNGQFTHGFFIEHNLQRFGGEMEGHGGLPFVTWAFVLLGLLPYSFFIIQGFMQGWKQRNTNDFTLFSFIVASIFIIFFSISGTKLPNYPMPSYPFIAVLIAIYLNGILDKSISLKYYKLSLWALFIITLAMPIAGYIALTYVETQLYSARFSSLFLIILPAGCVMALFYLKRKKWIECMISIGLCSMFLTVELFSFVYPSLVTQSPVSMAKGVMSSSTPTILYKGYDPAFLFNFQRTFPLAENSQEVIDFLKQNNDAIAITKEKFYEKDFGNLRTEILLKQKALFENYTIVIFTLNE